MKQKEILLFGASGQIGRNLIRKLSKNNYKIKAVTRNIHTSGYIIKTQANPGYLELVELKNFNSQKIEELMKNVSICINLIGILHERKKNQFENIHSELPDMLSKIANKCKLDQFIHLSSLGIEKANDSNYARSKLNGEIEVLKNFPTIKECMLRVLRLSCAFWLILIVYIDLALFLGVSSIQT